MKKYLLLAVLGFVVCSCSHTDDPLYGHLPAKPVVQAQLPAPSPTPPTAIPVVKFPSVSDLAAVAFEDRFPSAGDEDFNDFLTDFKIVEKINDQNQITDIYIDFYPRAVGASYDHSLLMVLNGVKEQPSNITLNTQPLFNGNGDVTLTHYDTNNNQIDQETKLPIDKDVVIFKSTHALFETTDKQEVINTYNDKPYLPALESARLAIHIGDPSLNPIEGDGQIDLAKYRMILHVMRNQGDTQHDIDIIDVMPSNAKLFDSRGYPYGFIIPANWRWPTEGWAENNGEKIDAAYPSFAAYRQYLQQRSVNPSVQVSQDVLNWYNVPGVEKYLYRQVPTPRLLPDP